MIISQEKNKSKSTSTSNEDSEFEIKKNKGNIKGNERLNGNNMISKGNNVNQRVINKEFFEEQMQKIGSGEVNNQKDKKNVNINKYSNKENVPINSYIPTINKVEIKSSIFKPKKIEFKDYYRLENDSLLKNYGSDIFRKIKNICF